MTKTFAQESLRTDSEKIIFATVEAVQKVKLFTFNGDDYERQVEHFVVGVKEDGVALEAGDSLPLSPGQYMFLPTEKKLLVNVGANPKTRNLSLVYRFFFSNAPFNLPYDLDDGEVVEWIPILESIGQIGQQLDDENTGIVLESSSSIILTNSSKYFDAIYDTLIWENQNIIFYSWFPTIPLSEKAQIFEGVVESKAFTETRVTMKVKDFVYKLKNQVDLGVFSESDGNILPSILNTPKRRIYGQADNVKCVSTDAILDGYNLTGTVAGTLAATILTGTGTLFLDELSPGDEIFVEVNEVEYKIGIESVDSNTQVTVSKANEISFAGKTIRVDPVNGWRKKNRTWHVAGHKLRQPFITISLVQSQSSFIVSSTQDFFPGDEIVVNGFQTNVRRISGNKIITTTNVVPVPVIGNQIEKRPVKMMMFGNRKFVYSRDYTVSNGTECIVTFDPLAEFNVTEQRKTGAHLNFTNGSRVLTTTANVDLRTIISPRDWIRSTNVGRPAWYEVLSVLEQSLTVRTPVVITGGPHTEEAYYKNMDIIMEDSLITANCLGMQVDDLWIRTPSDAVRHLILKDAKFDVVNEETFTKAKSDCNYTLSMCLPSQLGGKAPLVREVITNINGSVFGSLYGDSSQNISFSILNSHKPPLSSIIRDDDINSYSINSTQKIANKVIINYRPFIDVFTGENAFKSTTFDSKFVNDNIGIQNTIEKTIYLYDDAPAVIIAQRTALFNSLSTSSVTIKAKMIFSKTLVNDKVYLELDRLYSRYAGYDQRKLGTVTATKKDGYNTEITVTDLGNIYNRIPSICPAGSEPYPTSSQDDKIKWGYVLDDDTLTPDVTSEIALGGGVIG